MTSAPKIGFAGLSHLGICSAAAAAARGFPVVGYDPDSTLVERLSKADPPIEEPGLVELLTEQKDRLVFSAEIARLRDCDIVYLSLDVPTDDQGRSDLAPIRALATRVLQQLKDTAVFVVLCQVSPGFTRALAWPADRLFYQVETLIFGRAIDRAMHPERFIVGCADPAMPIEPRLKAFLDAFGCPLLPMRYESAELAKISINMCLIASVSVANVMAELSEKLGADWSEIVPALKLDRRIGPYSYLSPGLGLSGGNLERDLATVRNLAEQNGADGTVAASWDANSRHRKDWPWRTLLAMTAGAPLRTIAVLGLAYKENTASTKNSPALALLDHLKACDVRLFDPVVPASAAGPGVKGAHSVMEAVKDADALCIMTPWPEFRDIAVDELARTMRGSVIIDPYGMLDHNAAARAGLRCARLGRPVPSTSDQVAALSLADANP